MERYLSGHNGAVLKTVCLHGRMGSNPILSASKSLVKSDFGFLKDKEKSNNILNVRDCFCGDSSSLSFFFTFWFY